MKQIIIVTGNQHKLDEYKKILKEVNLKAEKIDLPELQGTVEEIVKEKAKLAAERIQKPCFVDDTSLSFNALGGLPGPYIKDFINRMKREDIVRLLDSFEDKSAVARAAIGYCEPKKEPVVILGEVEGTIVMPRGDSNFGWDPIFQPKEYDKTFAEMQPSEKNKISHRLRAAEAFNIYLQDK
jgi:inosine triphosphate pyrophosphatase